MHLNNLNRDMLNHFVFIEVCLGDILVVCLRICIAIRATIYRSLRALRAQNRKKVSKRVFSGVRKKVPENTRKSQKIPKIGLFGVFFDFFGYFGGLFCGPPKRLFLRLFCDFGPGGPGDSCKWSLRSQDLHRL